MKSFMTSPSETTAKYNVGLDLAKNSFQVYIVDSKGKIKSKKFTRSQLVDFFASHEPCNIGMEACGTSHYWARTFAEMGHFPFLIQPSRTVAFRSGRNKTDATDAQAICEAMLHHGTTFVHVKTVEQQDRCELIGRRSRLVAQRTQVVNQTRAYLGEHGIIIPQGHKKFKETVAEHISKHWDSFSSDFQLVLQENMDEYESLSKRIQALDDYISQQGQENQMIQRLMKINGFGILLATVLFALVGSAEQFPNGRAMANYFGLTPRESSTGGKQKLLHITKRGDEQMRTLLIIGAHAAINGLNRRKKGDDGLPLKKTKFEQWILELVSRVGVRKAMVATANKMVRIAWAVLRKGEDFDPNKAVRTA